MSRSLKWRVSWDERTAYWSVREPGGWHTTFTTWAKAIAYAASQSLLDPAEDDEI